MWRKFSTHLGLRGHFTINTEHASQNEGLKILEQNGWPQWHCLHRLGREFEIHIEVAGNYRKTLKFKGDILGDFGSEL